MITSVISGDIIKSRRKNSKGWLTVLKRVLRRYGIEAKDWVVFRGDSFQVEIRDARRVLAEVILIKAALKSVKADVRMAVGIGTAGKRGAKSKISESSGEAFVNSGTLLEGMKKKANIVIKSPWDDFDEEMNLYLELALMTMDAWTPSSAEIIKLSLEKPTATQAEIAKIQKISQAGVSAKQRRAGYAEIMKMEHRFRTLISHKLKK